MADSKKSSAHDSAQFKPFVWNSLEGLDERGRRQALFLNDARDAVDGACTLTQLLAWDEDRRDEAKASGGALPVLMEPQRASLQRLLIASLGMLQAEIERQCDALDLLRGSTGAFPRQ